MSAVLIGPQPWPDVHPGSADAFALVAEVRRQFARDAERDAESRRVSMTVWVSAATKERVWRLASRRKVGVGDVVRDAIADYLRGERGESEGPHAQPERIAGLAERAP